MRRTLLPILVMLAGCGRAHVDPKAVSALPLESKLDLLEAENETFAAVDAVDEASARIVDLREELRRAPDRIAEAKAALGRAEEAKNEALVAVAQLGVEEARRREDWLEAQIDLRRAQIKIDRARVELAEARLERSRARAVKKSNGPGAEKIGLQNFDDAVTACEERVKKREDQAAEVQADADAVRGRWLEAREALARATGGGQGSPWVP